MDIIFQESNFRSPTLYVRWLDTYIYTQRVILWVTAQTKEKRWIRRLSYPTLLGISWVIYGWINVQRIICALTSRISRRRYVITVCNGWFVGNGFSRRKSIEHQHRRITSNCYLERCDVVAGWRMAEPPRSLTTYLVEWASTRVLLPTTSS